MRLLRQILVVWIVLASAVEATSPVGSPEDGRGGITIYDRNPAHIWNRLHAVIFVRDDLSDTRRLADALDPPLWSNSSYLLAKPSHERVLRVLDEFLRTHGERLIQDPVKRLMLGHDLWTVFDWSAAREPARLGEPAYEREKQELQSRLAEVMRRVALSPGEIHALPSNYQQAVSSGQFAKEYDPAHRERAFLPPDLFDPNGPWVKISSDPGPDPAAFEHANTFSRSSFLIFMRLPGGRNATFDYLRTLWDFPEPWVPRSDGKDVQDQTVENSHLPQFPAGTEVALVRQMMSFDNRGDVEGTPITESIQIRVYRAVPTNADEVPATSEEIGKSGQDYYQSRLYRRALFASRMGGLRAAEANEKEFPILWAFGADEGSPSQHVTLEQMQPVLQTCVWCHRGMGLNSLNSRSRLIRPKWLVHDPGPVADPSDKTKWWEDDQSVYWKQHRYDWGLLSGYWKAEVR
jgi:hypothetical protein